MRSGNLIDARAVMELGPRSGEVSEATPLAEILPGDSTRFDELPRPGETPTPGTPGAIDRLRSLRHYLPFFGRKRG